MQNYFEVKASFVKIDDDGRERKVSESYLFDAVSFTDAEARITKQLAEIIRGEFVVDKINKSRITEVFPNESGEYWWKAKINIVTIDEKAGKEKMTSNYFLVAADDLKQALERLEEGLSYILVPHEVTGLALSPIIEVYPYVAGEDAIPSNLKPLTRAEEESIIEDEEAGDSLSQEGAEDE